MYDIELHYFINIFFLRKEFALLFQKEKKKK